MRESARALPPGETYLTVGFKELGLMFRTLGRLPHTGDKVPWEDWTLEIVDMDGRRIDKVLASLRGQTT